MKRRSPIAVLLLGVFTAGIYMLFWLVKTKGEMNSKGEKIPTAWIWLIPFVGTLWWMWKYSEGVGHVTNNSISGIVAFLFLFLLGPIGQAIIQNSFNKITESVANAPVETANVQPEMANTTEPVMEPVADAPVQPTYSQPVVEAPVSPAYTQPILDSAPVEPAVDVASAPTMTPPPVEPTSTPYGPSAV